MVALAFLGNILLEPNPPGSQKGVTLRFKASVLRIDGKILTDDEMGAEVHFRDVEMRIFPTSPELWDDAWGFNQQTIGYLFLDNLWGQWDNDVFLKWPISDAQKMLKNTCSISQCDIHDSTSHAKHLGESPQTAMSTSISSQ